jgi:segregation and condensation protein B
MGLKEKRLVESVLFSASKPVSLKEIKDATQLPKQKINQAIDDLMQEYNEDRKNETSMEITKAGDKYAMQVKSKFTDQSLMVAKPEIENNLLKTLTLIAFHQPVKQSNLRRMIGQKAYEHVDELAQMKLIHTRKHGTTEMLTTTKKFPEYFGIETSNTNEIKNILIKKTAGKIKDIPD